MRVLSLFDGISCGMLAGLKAGIPITRYVAYEIDKYAIAISKKNFPTIEQRGDVRQAHFDGGEFDLVIGGSPCQDLCAMGSRKGLEGEQSGLFFEYLRILNEVKPKFFLLENNASMTQENKDRISQYLGVEPILIDSKYFVAQDRKRLYWTNIPIAPIPSEEKYCLRDIVEPIENKQDYVITDRMLAKKPGTLAYKKTWSNVRTLDKRFRCITTAQTLCNSGCTNIKYNDNLYFKPTPIECERAQGLPDNYTDCVSNTQRYKCIGNGWTVDVIAHILKGLREV